MNLSLSVIETCSVGELFKYARDLDAVASNAWELKQKLIIKVMEMNGSVIDQTDYTEDIKQEKEASIIEDEKRRAVLKTYLDEVVIIYKTIQSFEKIKEPIKGENKVVERDDPLICIMKHEMPAIDEEFEKMSEIVKKKPNCSLLICGESGAGKSSFINLLLNSTLLPTSIRSNSSCLVRLTYGEHERAVILDLNSEEKIIEKSEFATNLNGYLENIENRKTTSCKSATIYLKSLILEGGLDIFDTIGLGETEMFNNELKKELNQITGIIFLLKKNNPIGDIALGGLSEIIHQLALNGLPWGSMNFIINMCDLLQGNKEKEELKKNLIEQLRDKCTLFSPEITTFSTKQELDFQKNNVMTTNFKDIIQMINQLHISSINTNTVKVFSFLMKFVIQTIDQINELEKYSASNKQERKDYIYRLRTLESDRKLINQSFKKQNQKNLNNEKRICRRKVEEYFGKEETKRAVVSNVINKQSDLYGMTILDEINSKIEHITHEEISVHFKTFIETEQILKRCCDNMLNLFITQFAEHQKKKDMIYKEMNRHIDGVMDVLDYDFKVILNTPSKNKGFLYILSPILVPIVNVKKYVQIESWFSYFFDKFNKKNIESFYGDTTDYVTRQCSAVYSRYVNRNSNIKNLMECLFKAPENVTTDFEKYLSDDMDYLIKNIQLLEDDMRKKEKVFGTYKEIKIKLEEIYENLCKFSLLRLQKEKKDVLRNKAQYSLDLSPKSENVKPFLKGRNRLVYQMKSESCIDSCIMVYQNKDGKSWKDLYVEYSRHNELNRMKHQKEDIISSKSFLELKQHVIFYVDDLSDNYPTFLVNGIDCSLTYYMNEKRKSLKEEVENIEKELYDEILKLLKQILIGLEYLHSKSLVHYDLTGDSIGFSQTYQSVKLTSISLPTKVNVKYEKKSEKYVLKMAHFPLWILDIASKEYYTETSDMYCLGILIYQMWLGISPFFNVIVTQNFETIMEFVNVLKKENHESIIMTESFNHGHANLIYIWSCQCRESKLTASQFLNVLQNIHYYGSMKVN